jgi:ABC-type transport system involved in multi-copper enzyme maturation permease subunit
MLKAIAWKEFRELLPVITAALVVEVLLICSVIGMDRKYTIHSGDLQGIAVMLLFEATLFAIVVGLWQNTTEQNQGTYLFLFHRPARREAIVAAKLLAGAATCLLVAVLPVLCFAWWADTRVWTAAASRDSIWAATWPVSFGLLLLYLGAFMSSLRAAAWYKSRYLPLLCGIALTVMAAILAQSWVLTVLTAVPLIEVCFVLAILFQATTRDYS